MLKLSVQHLLNVLLSGSPVRLFGQVLSGLAVKAVADAIRQDEDEYSSDIYKTYDEVLTDAYLMSGQNSEDF